MVKRKYGAAPDAGVWLGVQPARKADGLEMALSVVAGRGGAGAGAGAGASA